LISLLDVVNRGEKISIVPCEPSQATLIPFFGSRVPAGFPSPADDYLDACLDLNDLVIRHPAATFFVRVEGDSMIDAGIRSGDILVVDRALVPQDNAIVLAILDGEFTVKRLRRRSGSILLVAENPQVEPLEVTPEADFEIWGTVTYVVHRVK
jgi:DNA polymerase V